MLWYTDKYCLFLRCADVSSPAVCRCIVLRCAGVLIPAVCILMYCCIACGMQSS